MPYKILIFDADHTLFDFDQSEEIAFMKLLKDINLENDHHKLFPIYIEKNKETWSELEQGLLSQAKLKTERFQRFINASGIQAKAIDLTNIYTKHLASASILFKDAYNLIEQLSKKYRIVIVTNGLKEVQSERIVKSILAPFIETTIISDEIGIMKPDPKIIDYALDKIKHKSKNDVVIIGDSLTSDMQCGFNAGIDTIWYNPKSKENTLDKNPTYTISKLNSLLEIL
jgi:putative hydrolase of the HAD superfamily